MNPTYLFPAHPLGKVIVLAIIAYSAYILLRLYLLLSFWRSHNHRASAPEGRDGYIARAQQTLSRISNLEYADWRAVLFILREKELAKLNFARPAPNILLLMGLLGTVLGLAETVGSLVKPLSNALNNASPQDVFNLLSFTLQQMGTAFSCTLWGILAALIVGWILRSVTGKLQSLLSEWDTYIIQSVIPDVLPESQSAQIQSLQELINKSQEIVAESRRFLERIGPVMQEAAEQFKGVLTTAGEAMQQSVEKLTQTAQEMQEKLQYVAQGVAQSASALESSSRDLRESTAELAQYHTDLRNAHQELLTVFEQARSDLEHQIKGQLEKIGALDENFRRNAQDIVARINDAGRQFGEATQAFRQAGDLFTNEGVQIHSQIAHYHQCLTEYVENLLKDHRFAIDEVEKSVAAIRDSLHTIKESPVWQSRNGSDSGWDKVHEVLTEIQQVMGELRERPVPRMQEMTEAVVHTPRSAPSVDGKVIAERPFVSSATATTAILDQQEITKLIEAIQNLSSTISEFGGSASRDERPVQAVSDIQALVQSIQSLRDITADLHSVMLELSVSLKRSQVQPSKRKSWFSWLIPWRKGKR
ncbi:MAG: hypothetical protein KatS3mg023_2817 [Armatimonadota bacterium]|nr:MAG: hypothetical protein KatS3mg023_2817 [Armatimonadota bacterium]